MNEWWQARAPREQRTLIVGGIALMAILYFFMLWQPAQQGIATKKERLSRLREDVVWMEKAVARYQAYADDSSNKARSGDEAVYALADRTANEAGLGGDIDSITPEGQGRVRIRFAGAGFDRLIRWLGQLRDKHGVRATRVSIQRAEASGRVDARIVLTRGTT